MRYRIDIVEAFEWIVATRQGSELLHNGGHKAGDHLLQAQEKFPSDVRIREYGVKVGDKTAKIKFIYDYRVEGFSASMFIPLKDIILIKTRAKDLDRIVSQVRTNGKKEGFPLKNITQDGADVVVKKDNPA